VARAMLLVVLGLAGCATTPGGGDHAGQPQAPPSAESAYPVTPFARIETGMHVGAVKRIDVDAAERFLVSGSIDKTVRVWDLATGALLQTLRVPIDEGDVGKIYAVALSPDGSTVAAGGFTGQPGQQLVQPVEPTHPPETVS
jgi:WD40 domain-containing protein